MKRCFEIKSEAETASLGEKVGAHVKGGEIFELASDIGCGKTTLTRALVKGAGSKDLVHSPTFTVSNVYKANDLEIHHYDFYRIDQLGLMSEELEEVLENPKAVVIIEWAGEAHDLLPQDRLIRIELKKVKDDENARRIEVDSTSVDFPFEDLGAKQC